MRSRWAGITFETLCTKHVEEIKHRLGISGIHSVDGSWFAKGGNGGAQVDLLIDRDDHVVNLCEMKFRDGPFTIDAKYARELAQKIESFRRSTGTRKSILLTFITTYGLAINAYSRQWVQNDLAAEALFQEL
ncbi:MAG: hypothetical protein J5I62_09515 [Flavobacteriales bacterium]|nr:hypothetical protein [Flavobacteriales bacterium]MEB2341896.1 hypothetical protein [Flavobacteriia bacterium]